MRRYLFAASILILLFLGVYIGYLIFAPEKTGSDLSSQSIVSMLKQEGFLVTQTYIVNQQVKINNETGSVLRDFFWRQEILAFANMKVSSGVDLGKLTEDDISIDPTKVIVTLPPVEARSVELIGELTLQNKQGILKRIFDNESGYNVAYNALRSGALASATTSTLLNEAKSNTSKEIERLIRLAAPQRQILVQYK